jgi:hypothetical protein
VKSTTVPFNISARGRVTVSPVGDNGVYQISQSPMLSREEAADYVGLGINAFIEAVRSEKIAKRTKGHRPYHIDDLENFLASGEGLN